jgi:RHS repeat-associated protein
MSESSVSHRFAGNSLDRRDTVGQQLIRARSVAAVSSFIVLFLVLGMISAMPVHAACLEDGGDELCQLRHPSAPKYSAGDCGAPMCYRNSAWCRAVGGEPTGNCFNPNCVGDLTQITDTNMAEIGLRFSLYARSACSGLLQSDSGWGWEGQCSGYEYATRYSGGDITTDYRMLGYQGAAGAACSDTWSESVLGVRNVHYECPPGAKVSTAADGTILCLSSISGVCPINNPTEPVLGAKLHSETDFVAANGGLALKRHYYSFGPFRPRGAGEDLRLTSLGGSWRTNFDLSVHLIQGSAGQFFAVSRPDGPAEIFTGAGDMLRHFGRKRARLNVVRDAAGAPQSYEYLSADGRSERFSSDGKLHSVRYPNGDIVEATYAGTLLVSVADRAGRKIEFDHSEEGQILRARLPDGVVVEYTYDEVGNLDSVHFPAQSAGQARRYEYRAQAGKGLLTAIYDEMGQHLASYGYDHKGRVTLSERGSALPSGPVVRKEYSYSPWGGMTTVTDERNSTVRLDFQMVNGVWRLQSRSAACSTCASGRAKTIRYDSQGFIDVETDFADVQTDYDYDSQGRLLQKVEAANRASVRRTTQTDWHPDRHLPVEKRILDAAGSVVLLERWQYNARGQRTTQSLIDPENGRSRTTTYRYCEQADVAASPEECPFEGLVREVDGPRSDVSDVTRFVYHPSSAPQCGTELGSCSWRKGDLKAVVNALDQRTEYLAYDGAGRPTLVKDANGTRSEMRYNARGWVVERVQLGPDDGSSDDDRLTRIDYYPTGLVEQVTQPDGDHTRFEYDQAQRLSAVSDALGNRIDYTLDASGNRIRESITDARGQLQRRLSRVFDSLNRMVQLSDAAEQALSRITYDVNGAVDTVTDGNGIVSDQDHDPLGRLVKQIAHAEGVGAERAVTEFSYDAVDRLRSVVDPNGLSTVYTYDGLGDLVQLSSPDTGIAQYAHDEAGNRISQVDARGVSISMAYDALGRLVRQQSTGAATIEYTYDHGAFGLGRLSALSDGNTTNRWRYDRFGRVVEKDQISRGQIYTVRYEYSPGGRVTRITYPSGKVVDYVRDANGSVERIVASGSMLLDQARYQPFGSVSGWVWGNGERHERSYDLDGRLTALTVPLEMPQLHIFGYDGQYRISSAKLDDLQLDWTYDATGNRLSETREGATSSYHYAADSHRLQAISGAESRRFDYHAAGAMSRDDEVPLSYDHRNRLVAGYGATYVINGLGQRVEKAGAGAHTSSGGRVFVYDEAGQLLGEYDAGTGTALAEHVYLDTWPVGLMRSDGLYQVTPDHLGAPRTVVRTSDGSVVWNWRREPFGTGAAAVEQGFEYGLRFPGQYFDQESGLHYNYFRDYDPSTGRYIESDPIGLRGGLSTYGYTLQNPLRHTDPTGEATEAALGWCIAGGPANPLCDAAIVLNICKWAGIGVLAISLSGDSAKECTDDDEDCPKPKDCKQIKQSCIEMCSDTTLPTRDNGFSFFNCLNKCMEDNGCEGQ